MPPLPVPPSLQESLDELMLYLSDSLAPMMVAGAIEELMGARPEYAAQQIAGWTAAQYQGRGAQVPVSDYLFHALKKLHLLAELRLIPEERVLGFLGGLLPHVLTLCPDEDREILKGNLARLGHVQTILAAPVDTIYRQAGSEQPLAARGRAPAEGPPPTAAAVAAAASAAPVAAAAADEVAKGLKRFNLLLERLERSLPAGGGPGNTAAGAAPRAPKKGRDDLTAQLLATAASASRDARELEQNLARLRKLGVEVPSGDALRTLGESLPGWGIPAADSDAAGQGTMLGAMRRLITAAGDPGSGTDRFREMVQGAVEQVNTGSLARAATMLGLAEEVQQREKVDRAVVEAVRGRGHQAFSADRLRELIEKPENHPLLRRVFGFFPALSPKGLLSALKEEKKREGRRQLLALLEVHGPSARGEALDRLVESLSEGADVVDWYFQRNLLYVLRRIPRPAGPAVGDAELDALFRLSDPQRPAPLVKEALANLGQAPRSEKAEQVLTARLGQLEASLSKGTVPAATVADVHQLLDRTVSALIAVGTPGALLAAVEHALAATSAHGDGLARLSPLSTVDLSPNEDVVERLLRALRSALPVKVFGLMSSSSAASSLKLVTALSGTPAPAVRRALDDVVRKFGGQELGKAARTALASFDAVRKPAEAPAGGGFSGDLDVFGLPTLLQTFDQMQATGTLVLRDADGAEAGTLALEKGRLRGVATGPRRGLDAFFQLLERPGAGTFQFNRLSALRPEDATLATPHDLMPLLLEGMRRYDELGRAVAIVGDATRFRPTSVRPSRPRDENDQKLLTAIWSKAATGATPLECEDAVVADSYRVRNALLHWLDEGSLVTVSE